jgi:DNA-binding LacI/PurR family transcriptional regulator
MGNAPDDLNATQRVLKALRSRIHKGEWGVGARIPSVRAIAREYGVSINTVQRTLAQLEAEHMIECRPRRAGVVLAKRSVVLPNSAPRGSLVGVLYGDAGASRERSAGESWVPGILAGVKEAASRQRFKLVELACDQQNHDLTRWVCREIDALSPELVGIICCEDVFSGELAKRLDRRRMPWVALNPVGASTPHNFVAVDFAWAGLAVGRMLIHGGLTRMLLVGSSLSRSHASEMTTGLIQSYVEAGVPLGQIGYLREAVSAHRPSLEAFGREMVTSYLHDNPPPQVIIAMSDQVALGAIRACEERGLAVPGQVSVIGGTGLAGCAGSRPALSALVQPMTQMGAYAADMVLSMHRDDRMRSPDLVLPPQLCFGKTLGLSPLKSDLAQWVPQHRLRSLTHT